MAAHRGLIHITSDEVPDKLAKKKKVEEYINYLIILLLCYNCSPNN